MRMSAFEVMGLAKTGELLKHVTSKEPTYKIVNDDRDTVFESWTVWEKDGAAIEVHRFYRADMPDCYHSHPSDSMRMILEGGYTEEVYHRKQEKRYDVDWHTGEFGMVSHDFVHRIDRLFWDEPCTTLWWREPRKYDVKLIGSGWGDRENTVKGVKKKWPY